MIDKAINKLLFTSPYVEKQLEQLAGKSVTIDVSIPKLLISMLFEPTGVFFQEVNEPDLTLSGTGAAFLKVASAQDKQQALMANAIGIQGDSQVLMQLQALMENADIDVELLLSEYIGSLPAHQISDASKWFLSFAKDTGITIKDTSVNYLKHESNLLVQPFEIEQWMDDVDELTYALDRLEQRVTRLQNK